jgi:hypothetical protein
MKRAHKQNIGCSPQRLAVLVLGLAERILAEPFARRFMRRRGALLEAARLIALHPKSKMNPSPDRSCCVRTSSASNSRKAVAPATLRYVGKITYRQQFRSEYFPLPVEAFHSVCVFVQCLCEIGIFLTLSGQMAPLP